MRWLQDRLALRAFLSCDFYSYGGRGLADGVW